MSENKKGVMFADTLQRVNDWADLRQESEPTWNMPRKPQPENDTDTGALWPPRRKTLRSRVCRVTYFDEEQELVSCLSMSSGCIALNFLHPLLFCLLSLLNPSDVITVSVDLTYDSLLIGKHCPRNDEMLFTKPCDGYSGKCRAILTATKNVEFHLLGSGTSC